jgi:nucleotide-binding universal stress UspA family protein
MSYKSLLVHVEDTEAGRERLRTAIVIASIFGSRLIGVGARALNVMPDPIGLSIVKLKQEVASTLSRAETLFKEETAAFDRASCSWRAEIDFPIRALLRHAAGADLLIADRWTTGAPDTQASTADLIISGGVPVLVVPIGAKLDCTKVVIGWKDTREARHAIWDALPFLQRAKEVIVLRFAPLGHTHAPEMADLIERLQLHGIRAKAEERSSTEPTVAEDLQRAAAVMGAGLIVVGGYGHSRLREWVLGGVTQDLLEKANSCVLFSH